MSLYYDKNKYLFRVIWFYESGTFIRARGDMLSSQGDNMLPSKGWKCPDHQTQMLCIFGRNLTVKLLIYKCVSHVILHYLSRSQL